MGRYRGDNIPSISDYAHWNEDAATMWYAENRYDMEHADEYIEDDEFDVDDRDYCSVCNVPLDNCEFEGEHQSQCIHCGETYTFDYPQTESACPECWESR